MLRTFTFALSDAALSNGAQIKSAGSGLPQRVGPAELLVVGRIADDQTGVFGVNGDASDVALLSNGGMVTCYAARFLRQFDANGNDVFGQIDLGSQSALSIAVDEAAGEIYVAQATPATISVRALGTGALIRSFSAGLTCGSITIVGGDVIVGATTSPAATPLNVFSKAGVLTGTITNPSNCNGNLYDLHAYDDNVLYAGLWSITGPTKLNRTTMVATSIGTLSSNDANLGNIQGGASRGVWADSNDTFVMNILSIGTALDRFRTSDLVPTDRIISAGIRTGQFRGLNGLSTSSKHGMDVSATWLACWLGRYAVGRFDRRTASATFSRLFATGGTVQRIMLPGALGNGWDGSTDDRKTRCYYSTDGNTFAEFSSGTPLSIVVPPGATLTVRADMTTWAKADAIPPYIGGDSGEGPTLVYDDGALLAPGQLVGSLSSPAAIAGKLTQPAPIVGKVGS